MKTIVTLLLLSISALPGFGQLDRMDFHDELQLKFSVRFAATKAIGLPEDSIDNASGILMRNRAGQYQVW